MTNIIIHRQTGETGRRSVAAMLGCTFQQAMIAQEARLALNDLPDILLDDIGIPRSEIPYVAGVIAAEECEPRAPAWRGFGILASGAAVSGRPRTVLRVVMMTLIAIPMLVLVSSAVA